MLLFINLNTEKTNPFNIHAIACFYFGEDAQDEYQ